MNTKQFRVLCVGAGEQMTESLIPALQANAAEGVVIPALVDTRVAVAQHWATNFGIPRVYPDLDAALSKEAVDGVVIAVPHAVHHGLAAKALDAGKHVVLEKPFTDSAAQAADLIRRAGRRLVLMPNFQYRTQTRHALDRVTHGDYGLIQRGYASWFRGNGIPERPAFWATRSAGVGPDLASHLFSVLLPAMGGRPTWVMAHGSNARGKAIYGEEFVAFDTVAGALGYHDGRQAWFVASWRGDISADRILVELYGSRARLEIPLMAAELDAQRFAPSVHLWRPSPDGDRMSIQLLDDPLPTTTEECFAVNMRNWVRACRGQERLALRPEEALDVRLVLDAVEASARSNGAPTPIAKV